MPVETILALILIAVATNVVLVVALALPPLVRTVRARAALRRERRAEEGARPRRQRGAFAETTAVPGGEPAPSDAAYASGVPRGAYDRLIRITAWAFILITIAFVSLADLWPEARGPLIALLALGGLLVLLVHDVLPPGVFGGASLFIEGGTAIGFVTFLVGLTGGAASPFFFVYPLVVVGAALVVSEANTAVLAILAIGGYMAISLGPPLLAPNGRIATDGFAHVGVDVLALGLLAYVAAVVAREQRRSRDAAIRLSTIDSLTGLYNRAYFFNALDREIARSDRSGRRFCLLMMDLDGLKTTNDRFGHFVGDRVLRGVGDVIKRGTRKIDTPSRYGGDEFVVLLPETDPSGAFVLAEKIRQGVSERSFEGGRGGSPAIKASVSVGVVTYPDDGATADELMISADKAMYASKRGGKNRVIDYASARAGGTGAGTGGGTGG